MKKKKEKKKKSGTEAEVHQQKYTVDHLVCTDLRQSISYGM